MTQAIENYFWKSHVQRHNYQFCFYW